MGQNNAVFELQRLVPRAQEIVCTGSSSKLDDLCNAYSMTQQGFRHTFATCDISTCVENGVEVTPEFNLVGGIIVFVTLFTSVGASLLTCCLRSKATRRLSNVRSNLDHPRLKRSFAQSLLCQSRTAYYILSSFRPHLVFVPSS
jgi:hypothetical protein